MKIHKSHKIRLYPNDVQKTYFKKACGVSRFAYNWALSRSIETYEKEGKSLSGYDLSKRFNAIKHVEYPWVTEITKWASQKALYNLHAAYKNFFKNIKQGKKLGYPKFKKKNFSKESFYLGLNCVKLKDNRIKIPKLGWVKMAQRLRFTQCKIMSATISCTAGMWFVSITVEQHVPNVKPASSFPIVGVDVGIKSLAVTSDGKVYNNPKALLRNERKLKRLQRLVSRKQKGSSSRKKAVSKLSKHHYKISCIRKDSIHKATTAITKSSSVIVIEDLSLRSMLKNRKLSRLLSDASLSEFHRQIVYKSYWNGVEVIKADRYFPSSKTCSVCGNIKNDLILSDRIYICNHCGAVIDRDINAAINLKQLAVRYTESINACGERGSGFNCSNATKTKPFSLKQEKGNCVGAV